MCYVLYYIPAHTYIHTYVLGVTNGMFKLARGLSIDRLLAGKCSEPVDSKLMS